MITVLDSTRDSCRIQFDWPHGTIASLVAANDPDDNNIWVINRDSITGDEQINGVNGYVQFLLTPSGTTDTFPLTIRPPFRGFDIYDDFGNFLQNGAEIPFADLSYYKYHIYGNGATIRYQMPLDYGQGNCDKNIRLEWNHEHEDLFENTTNRHIPFEGPLTLLFGDDQVIASCIDKKMLLDDAHDQDVSNYPFEFRLLFGDNYRYTYTIRKFPYRERRDEDNNRIIVTKIQGDEAVQANTHARLIAYPIAQPNNRIELRSETDGSYIITPELRDAGPVIVTSSHKGYILPRFENYSIDAETEEERRQRHEETLNRLREDLRQGTEEIKRSIQWFKIATKQEDTTDRYLGLKCLTEDTFSPGLLMRFSYLLWKEIQDDEYEVEYLKDCLIKFSKELNFQWYWLYFSDRGLNACRFAVDYEEETNPFKEFMFDLYKVSLHGFVPQNNEITDEMITSLLKGEEIRHGFVDLNRPARNILRTDMKLDALFTNHPNDVWIDLPRRRKIIYYSNYYNRELIYTIFQNYIIQL